MIRCIVGVGGKMAIKNPQVQKLFVGRNRVQVRNLPQYQDKIKMLDDEVALGNLVKEVCVNEQAK